MLIFHFIHAIIPAKALKEQPCAAYNQHPCWEEHWYMHPVIGCIASSTGFMYNLRFYGNYIPFTDAEGNRIFLSDTSDDPMWMFVRMLFPSSGGVLSTGTSSIFEISPYINSPQKVAHVLKYIQDIRDGKETTLTVWDADTDAIFDNMCSQPGITIGRKERLGKKRTIEGQFTKAIKESIAEEEALGYPKYTAEQIVLTFLWEKFNTAEDLRQFYDALLPQDASASSSSLQPSSSSSPEPSNLEKIVDFVVQANGQDGSTPFKQATITPVSNNDTHMWDCSTHQVLPTSIFQDCVEVSIRHVLALLLYNPETKQYNTEGKQQLIRDFFNGLVDANDGTIEARTKWNQVVSCLTQEYSGLPEVAYNALGNNIQSGFLNITNVLIRILGLDGPVIEQYKQLHTAVHAKKTDEARTALNALFQLIFDGIKPDIEISINDFSINEAKTECYGKFRWWLSSD